MATALQHPASVPPMPAVARILSRFDRQSLASFIAVAIDLIDTLDGDDDTEANGDDELSGDEEDASNTEWHLRPWQQRKRGAEPPVIDEETEDDDADSSVDDQGEYTDEREPEEYQGGHADMPHQQGRMHVTA